MSKQPIPSESKKDSSQVTLDFAIQFKDLTFSESDLLGQGGYGQVYKGEWRFNTVAIKQYTTQDFSETTKTEIAKEAKIMATVSTQSDYLVRLKGVVLEKPHYSLVMEYLSGGDLFHLLKSGEELTWTRRYRIGLDIAREIIEAARRSGGIEIKASAGRAASSRITQATRRKCAAMGGIRPTERVRTPNGNPASTRKGKEKDAIDSRAEKTYAAVSDGCAVVAESLHHVGRPETGRQRGIG